MDLINIPACALYRNIGTVIVRMKMEVFEGWEYLGNVYHSVCKEPVHRPSGCERCYRTRLISKRKSDCDSVVDRCRPYRSRSARSRYFNVCAAVCSFLVFGSLSPQSSAAPAPSRTVMANMRSAGENQLWANPCDYNDGAPPNISPDQAKDIATKLSAQANNAYSAAASYKDVLSKQLHSYDKFDDLLKVWESEEWLRAFQWYQEGVLPKDKKLYSQLDDSKMSAIMSNPDSILPAMFKALKMIVASLHAFSTEGLEDSILSDESLKDNLNKTMHDARAVLCYFSDYMKSRGLPIEPLPDSEVPDFSHESKLVTGLLLYRDTLNFLEYLSQAFKKLE